MSPAREVELKLEVPAHSFYRLARSSLLRAARKKSSKPATLVSVYFDTDKLKLRNKGLSLRVRRIGRRLVQTIKRENGGRAIYPRRMGAPDQRQAARPRRGAGRRARTRVWQEGAARLEADIRDARAPHGLSDPKWS